ncbi:5-formyltetrahydrofolate cyclo-ligase [Glutamicibacter sp.]|uniref:5-formyltetrahydrofolate cyclo-ligase n=1 Tax=Glutamicibacter sp. TaxID=1931995 RepID=UPI0028BE8BE9|nr:5-formyltetrahydrofolate cyclo-ligase [Glutamicibacter sp.]
MDPLSKKSARAAVRAARKNIPEHLRATRAEQLCSTVREYLAQLTPVVRGVALYYSSPEEPDTEALMRQLVDDGIHVYLPVCEAEHRLSWVRWEPGIELERSAHAPVMEPVGRRYGVELFEQEEAISTLFIPALSIDSNGRRLGQGGGYYDRFLPRIEHTPVQIAALVYDEEYLPAGSFEVDAHDAPVDLVITPSMVHHII